MTESLDTKIHKIVIDEAYQQAALKRIRRMVSGNKMNPEDITLQSFEGEILQFQAEVMVDVLMSVVKKTVYGKAQASYMADSEHSAQDMMTREYLALRQDATMIQTVRDIITVLPAKGFGRNGLKIPLKFWRKSFVVHQPCPDCKSLGKVRCNRCAGVGTQNCSRCYGSGLCTCHNCNGATTISDPNRGRIPCPICGGRGKMSCPGCRQTGKVSCAGCAGRGNIQCATCNGSAWISLVQDMYLEANTKFDYPREKLPEKVVTLIEKRGEKLAEHAEIQVVPWQVMPVQIQDAESARNKIFQVPVLYNVILPYSHLSFEMKGKTYYAFLFGVKGTLDHVSNFLDDLLSEAQRKLEDATQARGDILENLRIAAEFRTAREAMVLASQYAPGRALAALRKTNALGLSEQKAKSLVLLADNALKKLTLKPRVLGSVVGQMITGGAIAGYLLSPFRGMILQTLPPRIPAVAIDLVVVSLAAYLGALTIQAIAGASLKRTMAKIMPNGMDTILPKSIKLGNAGLIHAGLSLVSLIGILEASRILRMNPPEWYIDILGRILTFIP